MNEKQIQQKIDRKKKWYIDNSDRLRQRAREYQKEHPEHSKQWKKDHPHKYLKIRRNSQLKKEYGITFEQQKQMYIAQGGCCAIHGGKFENRADIHVDHNHSTGQVRQLLCQRCNMMIGLAKEDVSRLAKAVDYINKWNQ
jgi:hypothetical protein